MRHSSLSGYPALCRVFFPWYFLQTNHRRYQQNHRGENHPSEQYKLSELWHRQPEVERIELWGNRKMSVQPLSTNRLFETRTLHSQHLAVFHTISCLLEQLLKN